MDVDSINQIMVTGSAAPLMGLFVGMLWLAMLTLIIIYVYSAIALMTIAHKTNTKNAWLAWIPIANFYLMTQIAKVSGLWTLILLAVPIPSIGGLAILAVSIWLLWRISERRNLPGWISLLAIIPLLNLVVLGILAWYNSNKQVKEVQPKKKRK